MRFTETDFSVLYSYDSKYSHSLSKDMHGVAV